MADNPTNATGERIRARRLDLGVRQAELAEAAAISPSYLNLIEHGRRRIKPKLLELLAQALDVSPELLADGADRHVLDAMRQAAGAADDVAAEIDKTEELASRYPGWASVIAAQHDKIAALEARAQLLTDRMSYDPALADALHRMISAVTAIRSTASILTSDDDIDADWQGRFHRNIHADAVRLATDSEALIGYLEPPEARDDVPISPLEEAEALLDKVGWVAGAIDVSGLRAPTRDVLKRLATRQAADADALPEPDLAGTDPWQVAEATGASLALVLRRLGLMQPETGLVICDAGGFPTLVKEASGFSFPRGSACPLWPIYAALGQPGRPVVQHVALTGKPTLYFDCIAIAEVRPTTKPGASPEVEATMLVRGVAAPAGQEVQDIGRSCRICPKPDCTARREPSAVAMDDRL